MPSLVKTFQADIISGGKSVTELLRTAKLISAKLGLNEISGWLERELGGYDRVEIIPDYRMIHGGRLEVLNPYRGWLPSGQLDIKFPVGQSIAEVEHLSKLKSVVHALSESDKMRITSNTGMDISEWQQQIQLPPLQLRRIVDAVRPIGVSSYY
jgi:hypothetical protein